MRRTHTHWTSTIACLAVLFALGIIILGLLATRPKQIVAVNCPAVDISIQQHRNVSGRSFVDIDVDTDTLLQMSMLEMHRYSINGDTPSRSLAGDMHTITYAATIPHVLSYRLTNWCGSYIQGIRMIWW